MNASVKKTHFGFQSVDWDEKEKKVREVFHSVAQNYDLMNDVMSLGIHRLWKRLTIGLSHVKPGHCVLDLAGGSGDLSRLLSARVGEKGRVVLADINAAMLQVASDKGLDEGFFANTYYVQADAENLPFASNHFDCITMGFGLRNVRDKEAALKALFRVCKPGGKLMILEFSKPTAEWMQWLYDVYSFTCLPLMGEWIAKDKDSYQYLAESIRMHPAQEALKQMIENAGFEDCIYHNLTGGIVALHIAYKY